MSLATPLCRNRSAASWILSACEWASSIGIYLLPVFYVAFFATLFLLWREPRATFWLIAAGGALGWAMTAWAIVFCLASTRPVRATVHGRVESAHPGQPRVRPVPLRFAQMPTRSCRQACSTPSGSEARFSVACFHARCAAANNVDASGIDGDYTQASH
ncbi:hypothetical protein [Paraburkholderia tagetis]|uniref:Uncharacterized protein n=1 Tax=Paraburkholderia tagetis TaxID=2913261 RepID=A0A9X1RLR4_9BURK|nr:hypothetical protein [Paraburkholderia tagetis]MCG5072479.1 hypothetical protein [Paraburkholderia tagetis]